MTSPQISSIPCHFVLREVVYQTKYCSSLKVKIFGTSKNFDLATSLALLFHFAMIKMCMYLYSSNQSPKQRHK